MAGSPGSPSDLACFSVLSLTGSGLITHSFNRKCLHFQSVGGWRPDKLGVEAQNGISAPPSGCTLIRERARTWAGQAASQRKKDGSAVGVRSALSCFCSGTFGGLGWFRFGDRACFEMSVY